MDSSRRVSEFSNTCGGGEFDGCEGRILPFLDDTLECVSESIMLQKTRSARAGGKPNNGEFCRCCYTHKRCPSVVTDQENTVSQVERQHSDASPSLGSRVCVVVCDEDGNHQFFYLFSIIKDSHTFKHYRLAQNLKSPNYLHTSLFFISSPPITYAYINIIINSHEHFHGTHFFLINF